MRHFIYLLLGILCMAMPVAAQDFTLDTGPVFETDEPATPESGEPESRFSATPLCSLLENQTDYRVYGVIRTDTTPTAGGVEARHEITFTLNAGQSREICSTGPFFAGRRVELVLRSIVPLFDCKTRLGAGPIAITATRRDDNRGFDWQARCY